MNYAVIGSQYGDEGKGRVVDSLVKKLKGQTIVVRYNGGAQAGHTVKFKNGDSHVFHHFGSGTIRGAATYWSEYCIFDPVAFVKERSDLINNFNIDPVFFVDPNAMIVTPYDIAINRMNAILNKHGSCGMGINECIRRNEDSFLSLRVAHFQKDFVIATQILQRIGLKFVKDYYQFNELKNKELFPDDLVNFINNIVKTSYIHDFIDYYIAASDYFSTMTLDRLAPVYNIVFEGAQGLLLDEHFGNYPYVTPSRTGSINIVNICRKYNIEVDETIYVTRPYLTRHGNDPHFESSDISDYFNIVDTTNVYNDWQKTMKFAPINSYLLYKAINSDLIYNKSAKNSIAITCVDQIVYPEILPIVINESIQERSLEHIVALIRSMNQLDNVYKFDSPYND